MPLPIDPRMLQMLQRQRGLTLNSNPIRGRSGYPGVFPDEMSPPTEMRPPVTPVASNAAGAPYGAIPIRPGGFAGDQGQGMPMTGTMERSMINMEQAKQLQQALRALRLSTGK